MMVHIMPMERCVLDAGLSDPLFHVSALSMLLHATQGSWSPPRLTLIVAISRMLEAGR